MLPQGARGVGMQYLTRYVGSQASQRLAGAHRIVRNVQDELGPCPVHMRLRDWYSVRVNHGARRHNNRDAAFGRQFIPSVAGERSELRVGLTHIVHAQHALGLLLALGLDGYPERAPQPGSVSPPLTRWLE